MSTKGMHYNLTRIENDHVAIGSRPQTIEDVKRYSMKTMLPSTVASGGYMPTVAES